MTRQYIFLRTSSDNRESRISDPENDAVKVVAQMCSEERSKRREVQGALKQGRRDLTPMHDQTGFADGMASASELQRGRCMHWPHTAQGSQF